MLVVSYMINTIGMFIVALWSFYYITSENVFRTKEHLMEYIILLSFSFLQFIWLGVLCDCKFNRFLRNLHQESFSNEL